MRIESRANAGNRVKIAESCGELGVSEFVAWTIQTTVSRLQAC